MFLSRPGPLLPLKFNNICPTNHSFVSLYPIIPRSLTDYKLSLSQLPHDLAALPFPSLRRLLVLLPLSRCALALDPPAVGPAASRLLRLRLLPHSLENSICRLPHRTHPHKKFTQGDELTVDLKIVQERSGRGVHLSAPQSCGREVENK